MSLANSAKLQFRLIFALMLRRIRTRYAGSRAGYVWALLEPVAWVFILKLSLQHGGTSMPPLGDSFEVFLSSGIIIARTWRVCCNMISRSLLKRKSGGVPSLNKMDSVYANWLLEIITGGVAMITVLAILEVFGFEAAPANLFVCVVAYLGFAVYALAFGLAFSLLLVVAPGIQHFTGIILIVLFITSGFGFMLDRMPIAYRQVVSWNPLVHCIEWFREGFFAGYECRNLDLEYLAVVTIACMLIGLAGERVTRRHESSPVEYGDELV